MLFYPFAYTRLLLLVLILLAPCSTTARTTDNTSYAASTGELSMVFLRFGNPVFGAALKVDDDIVAFTNELGAIHVIIPSGTHRVALWHERKLYISRQLHMKAGEDTQLIVSVPNRESAARVQLESSKSKHPRANEALRTNSESASGTLTGQVTSAQDNKPLASAQIYISGSSTQLTTDASGHFKIRLSVGNYSLSVILSGYAAKTIENLHINPDTEHVENISLTPAGLELEEYVVLAPYIEGSVSSAVQQVRNTSEVKEILGAEQMSQAGDSSAASALQRITGLTIEDGKYVVIRGQPSRYTLSLLNGSELPSPDPIRRVVPLDLFPTDVLAGIEVQKSYSADKPGSFGGGMINLHLRGIPEQTFANVSLGSGYNNRSSNVQGLTYKGGDRDFLGEDDGTRAMPADTETGSVFSNIWHIYDKKLPLDRAVSFAAGSGYRTDAGEFGILGSLSWGQKYRHANEVHRTFAIAGQNQVVIENDFNIRKTTMNANLGGLLVLTGKWRKHSLTSNTLLLRDTDKIARIEQGFNNTSDGRYERNYLLDWNQRQIRIQQFLGKHEFDLFNVDWKWLTAHGSRQAPDRRTYSYYRTTDGSFLFYEESGGQRRFNIVEDTVDSHNVNFTVPVLQRDTLALNIKVGLSNYRQDRSSNTSRFRFEPSEGGLDLTPQNPELILDPRNIGNGLDFLNDTQSTDDYTGNVRISGQYILFDLDIKELLKLNFGLRNESADFEAHTFSSTSLGNNTIVGKFTQTKLLPSATATWIINDSMQLRAGLSSTVSRPVLVELTQTLFFDPESGDVYRGNPKLKPTEIDGYDLRWEWYFSNEEMLNIGTFLRNYTSPIERYDFPVGGGGKNINIDNAKSATVFGLELGGRISLDNIFEKIYVQSNISLMDSSVELINTGILTNTKRPLQGQANYVINLQVGRDGEVYDWTVTFNQVGDRLSSAGTDALPDIYQEPVPVLDAKWKWHINKHMSFDITGSNLLDPEYRFTGAGITEKAYKKGRTFKSSIRFDF